MKRLKLISVAALLSACQFAVVDVEEVLPDANELAGEAFVHSASQALSDLSEAAWWQRFEDSELNRLVEAALAGNLDLVQAAARVSEAETRLRSVTGSRGAIVTAGVSGGRRFDGVPASGRVYSNSVRPELNIAWQADLFGRLSSIERARYADYLASEENRLALAHSLVAQVARFRVRLSVLERQKLLAEEVIESRARTLEIVEGRYSRGVNSTSAVAVHQARENSAAARADMPAIERELELAYLALDELLGVKPGSGARLNSLSSPLPNADAPPAGIPIALLDRRPDLRAARAAIESAVAEVDASVAAQYPDLTLSAAVGWSDDGISDLFSSQTLFGSLFGNLTAPLFNGGQLEANTDGARARLEGFVAAYAATILQAVREVEDALAAERGLLAELDERTQQRDEALIAETLARDRYGRGLENLLVVLDTERRRSGAENQVLVLQAAVWNARIDLLLALGGDWFQETNEDSQ